VFYPSFRYPVVKVSLLAGMRLRNFIKISGFLLITIGTAGLLLNEFVLNSSEIISHNRAIVFAVANFVGLVNLAFAHFGMKKTD
jgi:hypothetical protein